MSKVHFPPEWYAARRKYFADLSHRMSGGWVCKLCGTPKPKTDTGRDLACPATKGASVCVWVRGS